MEGDDYHVLNIASHFLKGPVFTMVSRTAYIFRRALFHSSLISFFLSVVFCRGSLWGWISWGLWLISSILNYIFCACPHCHRRGNNGLFQGYFEENAGYCNYCGKLVEFKENVENQE